MNQRELLDAFIERAGKLDKAADKLCTEVGELYGNGGLIHNIDVLRDHSRKGISELLKSALAIRVRVGSVTEQVAKRASEVPFTPADLIGQRIIKRSEKPFKGGDKTVIVTGIRLHPKGRSNPKLESVLVFTYDYLDKEVGGVAQSYVECRRVRRATAIDMQRHVLDFRP